MAELLLLLLLFAGAIGGAWLFRTFMARRIASRVARSLATALAGCVLLIGLALTGLGLAFGEMYPTSTHPIDDTYYFTQQEYGFVTTSSSGYNLTLYQQQPYWFDRALGKVQLECAGREIIKATITPAPAGRIRLQLAADNQQQLDTTLSTTQPFNFRRTFEGRTVDFSQSPH